MRLDVCQAEPEACSNSRKFSSSTHLFTFLPKPLFRNGGAIGPQEAFHSHPPAPDNRNVSGVVLVKLPTRVVRALTKQNDPNGQGKTVTFLEKPLFFIHPLIMVTVGRRLTDLLSFRGLTASSTTQQPSHPSRRGVGSAFQLIFGVSSKTVSEFPTACGCQLAAMLRLSRPARLRIGEQI